MPTFPPPPMNLPGHGNTIGPWMHGGALHTLNPTWSDTVHPAAKLVTYWPVRLYEPYVITALGWRNGATVAGNVDVGLYSIDGRRLTNTGSTAMSGATAIQSVTLGASYTAVVGTYYLAFTSDSATASFLSWVGGGSILLYLLKVVGLAQETTGSFGLPATWTGASVTQNAAPAVFATTRSVI